MKKIIFLFLFLIVFARAEAATRTIDSDATNWSATTSWVEGAVPTTSDAVVANASSASITIDTTTCVASTMVLTGYTGTMTFTAGQKLTVTTTVTFVAGMSLAGTGTLQLGNTATITSGGLTFPGSLIFDAGTWTLGDNWTVTGNVTFNTGTNTLNTNTLNIGGSLTINGVTQGTTAFVLNGTGTWSGSSTTGLSNPLTINTAGTITLSGTIRYGYSAGGVLTYTAGSMVFGTSVLTFMGSCTVDISEVTWGNISPYWNGATITMSSPINCASLIMNTAKPIFAGGFLITCSGITGTSGGITLSGDIDCNGDISAGGIALDGVGSTVYVSGNLTLSGSISGTADIVLDGTGTWSTSTAALSVSNNVTINTAGTITIGTYLGYKTGTLTYTAGTVDTTTNSSTLNILDSCTLDTDRGATKISWYNITTGAASTITLSSDLTLTAMFESSSFNTTFAGAYNVSCDKLRLGSGKTLTLVASQTLDIATNLYVNGADTTTTSIVSSVAETATNLHYNGTATNCQVYEATFTDVDASGSAQVIDNWYGGTLTRCTNITNRTSADIGGAPAAAGGRGARFTIQ